jgi:hypothetical protein
MVGLNRIEVNGFFFSGFRHKNLPRLLVFGSFATKDPPKTRGYALLGRGDPREVFGVALHQEAPGRSSAVFVAVQPMLFGQRRLFRFRRYA